MKKANAPERVIVNINLLEDLYLELEAKSLRANRPAEEIILSAVRRDMSNPLKQKEEL